MEAKSSVERPRLSPRAERVLQMLIDAGRKGEYVTDYDMLSAFQEMARNSRRFEPSSFNAIKNPLKELKDAGYEIQNLRGKGRRIVELTKENHNI